MEPKFLGKPTTGPSTELDVIPNPGIDVVTMTSDEVTAFCPVTAQPDYYDVAIEFVPDQHCIESKSLKLYLWHFRDRQIFAETLTVEIKDKVVEVINPIRCTVTTIQKSRGGIEIKSVARFERT